MLWFLHMPKTGGSAVTALIRSQHRRGQVIELGGPDETMPRWRWPLARAVVGHWRYGLHERDPDPMLVTVLRHPVARLTSLYHYIRRTPDHHSYQRVRPMTLEEFLLSDLPQVHNQQAGFLGDDALTALATFDVVGVQEDLDAVADELAEQMGWSAFALPERNRRPGQRGDSISRDVERQVLERNAVDLELWEMAREQVRL